jgi:hypothetical protein
MNVQKPAPLVSTSTFFRWEGDREPRFVHDLSQRLAADSLLSSVGELRHPFSRACSLRVFLRRQGQGHRLPVSLPVSKRTPARMSLGVVSYRGSLRR